MATSTRPGDVLAGRYRLIDLLTESGGGRFWRAHDNILERYVALHVISAEDPRAPLLMAAARESATVLDARILRVLDAEILDGKCFVVNEWGTGTSLDILVTAGGPLGPRRSAWLAAEVAGALAAAHSRGVAHGRLNPENVLIDRLGAVRLIGLCVDAALHGLPAGRIDQDRHDLGGVLYCALTATWPGPSDSIVPGAPHDHDAVLPPRRVRAGVPRPLDLLWTEISDDAPHRRRWPGPQHQELEVSTAGAVRERLMDYLGGDPSGLPEALAGSIPPINEIRPVVLPQVPEMTVRDFERAAQGEPDPEPAPLPALDEPPIPSVAELRHSADPTAFASVDPIGALDSVEVDIPTEAGMPVFADEDDEVEWLRARSSPPPPPPPFEPPPERPLFAPEPPEGAPSRRLRIDPSAMPHATDPSVAAAGFWPWDTGTGQAGPGRTADHTAEHEVVPGRNWLRLAMVIAATLLLLVAVVVAFNLGRGRTPLGAERDEPSGNASRNSRTTDTTASSDSPLAGVTAASFDPLSSDGEENDAEVGLAVDGDPATSWTTSTYQDQLGPSAPALKSGVGLYLDLGAVREIAAVDLDLVGSPTDVQLFVTDTLPEAAPTGEPVAADTASAGDLTLEPASPEGDTAVTGRYVVVWFTSLPVVSGGYRVGLAEVVVHGR
ncbi:hypothetical protein F0U44_20650 [Nocardioides humilatus]|uniref:non-specific serine/threonine protein kinase n=1 Tax=Nocardioides humilatus TaxID=2607660 RepID=A0A5B1L6W0_9ACTN|nr:protein kinase family protein [Nocardioides humilatus]KAA1415407.1 hypothetical protein F0U44_20650 [Nocardioides humilatus]